MYHMPVVCHKFIKSDYPALWKLSFCQIIIINKDLPGSLSKTDKKVGQSQLLVFVDFILTSFHWFCNILGKIAP